MENLEYFNGDRSDNTEHCKDDTVLLSLKGYEINAYKNIHKHTCTWILLNMGGKHYLA